MVHYLLGEYRGLVWDCLTMGQYVPSYSPNFQICSCHRHTLQHIHIAFGFMELKL